MSVTYIGGLPANDSFYNAALADPDFTWANIPLASGWESDTSSYLGLGTTGVAQYRQIDSWVFLSGRIKRTGGTTTFWSNPLCPIQQDPGINDYVQIPLAARRSTGVSTSITISRTAASCPDAAIGDWISLDGIAFREYIHGHAEVRNTATSGFASPSLSAIRADGTQDIDLFYRQMAQVNHASFTNPSANTNDPWRRWWIGNFGGVHGSLCFEAYLVNYPGGSIIATTPSQVPVRTYNIPCWFKDDGYALQFNTSGQMLLSAGAQPNSGWFCGAALPFYRMASNHAGVSVGVDVQPTDYGNLAANAVVYESTAWYPKYASVSVGTTWTHPDPIRAYRTARGMIALNGAADGSSAVHGELGTLPVGYRPGKVRIFNVATNGTNGSAATREVVITPFGDITLVGGNRPNRVYLDAVHFWPA